MTKDEILKIAKECGAYFEQANSEIVTSYASDILIFSPNAIKAFVKALQGDGEHVAYLDKNYLGKPITVTKEHLDELAPGETYIRDLWKDAQPLFTYPPDQTARIKWLEEKLEFQDNWLSKGVYFTTEEYIKECADFTRQNTKLAKLQKQLDKEKKRADSWVDEVRNLARDIGNPDEDSNGSIQDWKRIKGKLDELQNQNDVMRDALEEIASYDDQHKYTANKALATVKGE